MEPCKNDGMPPRTKLPHCRSVPWPVSMGKGRRRGTTDGGKITLLPTHLHPQCRTRKAQYQLGGWLEVGTCLLAFPFVPDHQGASAHPAGFLGFCSVPAEPHDPSSISLNHSSTRPLLFPIVRTSRHLCLCLSLIFFLKLALTLAFPPAGHPINP